jgi:hypothetical protein
MLETETNWQPKFTEIARVARATKQCNHTSHTSHTSLRGGVLVLRVTLAVPPSAYTTLQGKLPPHHLDFWIYQEAIFFDRARFLEIATSLSRNSRFYFLEDVLLL